MHSAMEDGHRELAQSPLSPSSFLSSLISLMHIPKEKGKLICDVSTAYGRFLCISTMTAPTTIIAMMMPMTAGTKYRSAAD
jgi:hypothetical protein